MYTRLFFFLALLVCQASAQITRFPHHESFDNVVPPALPAGWGTSSHRSPSGDFTTTHSSPRSDSSAVISTNATIGQYLTTPILDFSGKAADSLVYYERRSSSHTATLLVEASIDGGNSFPVPVSDTLRNPGTTSYVRRALKLPTLLNSLPAVMIRWRTSDDGAGATGTIRFDDITITARVEFDVAIGTIRYVGPPSSPNRTLHVTLRNHGLAPVDAIPLQVFIDRNDDSLPQPDELIRSMTVEERIPPDDSVVVPVMLEALPFGRIRLMVSLLLSSDQDPSNNLAGIMVSQSFPEQSVVVNEIMYDPLPGGSEYVELFNRGGVPVDLNGWTLTDRPADSNPAPSDFICLRPFLLRPGNYLVVASDSSIFMTFPELARKTLPVIIRKSGMTLNNDGDRVILADMTRATIDSLGYTPLWHNPQLEEWSGRSLERINPDLPGTGGTNWGTCARMAGGTPGEQNSLFTSILASGVTVAIQPNPFSPDGDGIEDVTLVEYALPASMGLLRIRIYDHRGHLVKILADGEPAPGHGTLVWNGLDGNGQRVAMGIYIVLFEALGVSGENLVSLKGTIVVAGRLE